MQQIKLYLSHVATPLLSFREKNIAYLHLKAQREN